MRVEIQSSALIKQIPPPKITTSNSSPPYNNNVPLSIFDKTTYNTHFSVIFAFPTPNPQNSALKLALQRLLSDYPEWAGRLGLTDSNEPTILLNNEGVRFVEAKVGTHTLHQALPYFESTHPALLTLIPSHDGGVSELVQVQLTRFGCGSLVVGFTSHHRVADAHSVSNFLVAWGKTCRGLDIGPLPTHRRNIFMPRVPPRFQFEHRGVEFTTNKEMVNDDVKKEKKNDVVVVQKVHFTMDFINKLKSKASASNPSNRTYSTFEILMAHLWRVITLARGLQPYQTTKVKISVNGRTRVKPRLPNEYFGNLVLWALPKLEAGEVVNKALSHVADTIHDAVSAVDDNYFRSFIDYSAATIKMQADMIPTAELSKSTLIFPNLEVDSWLRFPFYEVDFGGGSPSIFMPLTVLVEGLVFLLPSLTRDGSVDAFVHLFHYNLSLFNQNCYNLII